MAKKNVRRERGRLSRLIQLLFALALLAAVTVGATVFFRVEQVLVTGNHRYTQEEIVAATGISPGDNLFHMNKFAIQERMLEEMPYLEHILIRRSLPSTIEVTVSEWDATAWIAPDPRPDLTDLPEDGPRPTDRGWLISVDGKVLEQTDTAGDRIPVTGLTGMDTREGLPLAVAQEQQTRLNSLLALLGELERRELLTAVSGIRLASTNLVFEYLGRYDVKLPLNADMAYAIQAMLAAAEDREQVMGPLASGSFDLTQNFTVVYSPQRLKS